ncbi:hypothetical protein RRF57_009720 [Xylaria bambusicola]|uniref:Uncharacterized protein n=1 Tax=Xylaria bambusicola TaxID=326684 RepID=A0AAN7UW33_9PEZI
MLPFNIMGHVAAEPQAEPQAPPPPAPPSEQGIIHNNPSHNVHRQPQLASPSAERIHSTKGREQLWRFCLCGFLTDVVCHAVLGIDAHYAVFSAVKRWIVIYTLSSASLDWAAWKVDESKGGEEDRRGC